MAMTAAVKDELARVELSKSCCRKAEVSALLRFAGGLHLVAHRVFHLAAYQDQSLNQRLFLYHGFAKNSKEQFCQVACIGLP